MESHSEEKDASQAFEMRSQASSSKSSRRSSRSSASVAATRARAKAETARAKAYYTEKEAAMMSKKAEVEADLFVLQSQKEATAATAASAEAAIYEAAADIEEGNIDKLVSETHSVRTHVPRSMFRSMQLNNINSSSLILQFHSHPLEVLNLFSMRLQDLVVVNIHHKGWRS